MYFSSQGAAKVIGPVLAQTARLLFIGTGGWWLSTHDATAQDFFVLAAASMVVLGVLSCAQRDPDAMGAEAAARAGGAAGVVVTIVIAGDGAQRPWPPMRNCASAVNCRVRCCASPPE